MAEGIELSSRVGTTFAKRRADGAKAGLIASLIGGLTAVPARAFADRSGWLAWLVDLATHWQWLYLVIGTTCAALLIGSRSARWTIPALALIVLGWISSSPPADTAGTADHPPLTVVNANLHVGNRDTALLQRWVASIDADIVVIEEVSPTTAPQLEQWKDYPHRIISAEEGPFGLAILSRHPLIHTEALEADGQPLRFRTRILWQGQAIALGALHPVPPISPEYHLRRARLFESEARWAQASGSAAVIVGDLNASPWSSAMHGFVANGLRRATGLAPSWPAALPIIAIDHVLVSPNWHVAETGVGPDIGSDHRPVFAVLALSRP